MRFGVCCSIADSQVTASAGYDYVELSVAGDLRPEGSEVEWHEQRTAIDSMPLRPETFNSFVRTGKIVGPDADPERLQRYVHVALSRAAQVGGKIVVFGSGGARSIPDGVTGERANTQIVEFLTYCAQAYEETGVIVVIEPLFRGECNFINLVSEGAALSRQLNSPGVRNLADTYHMEAEHEDLQAVVDSADVLAHVHTADSGRLAPGTGSYDHVALFRTLNRAKYNDRLSIECSWQGRFADLAQPALECLKRAWLAAEK